MISFLFFWICQFEGEGVEVGIILLFYFGFLRKCSQVFQTLLFCVSKHLRNLLRARLLLGVIHTRSGVPILTQKLENTDCNSPPSVCWRGLC